MIRILSITICLLLFFVGVSIGQTTKPKIYDPEADAKVEIEEAVDQAKSEGKHVLLQIGGNWCSWCIKFHTFINEDPVVDSVLNSNYVFLLVNHSRENQNLDILANLGYPHRFGFPVLVVLDERGKKLHIQNSAYLEKDKSYDRIKLIEFLKLWSPAALDPENYKL